MQKSALARILIASAIVLSGVAGAEAGRKSTPDRSASVIRAQSVAKARTAARPRMTERECMARAMYFESNRSQKDGMLAVGTIVANRLQSGRYGASVCEVVSRRLQFAPGVLTRPMLETKVAENARKVADAVLGGERHPLAGDVMFFHTANVPFRNDDKQYVLVSGGNAFYRWSRGGGEALERQNLDSLKSAFAASRDARAVGEQVVALALKARPDDGQPPVAAEIATPAPDSLAVALAYAAAPRKTALAREALAVVSKLKPQPAGPRVIEPAAPVLASAGPVWTSIDPQPSATASFLARANAAVAQAWDAVRTASIN